jgi:hypothetical protein
VDDIGVLLQQVVVVPEEVGAHLPNPIWTSAADPSTRGEGAGVWARVLRWSQSQ